VRRYRYSKWRWRVLVRALDLVGAALVWLWRRIRPVERVRSPKRILIVQLDHLGDAVLSSPLFPRLREAYREARIDVLASPTGAAVFQSDPNVDRVIVARRTWFERRRAGWALGSAVWDLGREARRERYDLGIDVRGDVLSVIVLALAGIPQRVGWSMGGGGFLLTDIAKWVPGRHEVQSRLALIEQLGLDPGGPAQVLAYPTDGDRAAVAAQLAVRWGGIEGSRRRRSRETVRVAEVREGTGRGTQARYAGPVEAEKGHASWIDPEQLHAGRFGDLAPLLAVHLGAGTVAKRWPISAWRELMKRFLSEGWRVVVVGGPDDLELATDLPRDRDLLDLTGKLAVTQTAALLERADLFIGADSAPAHLAACARTPSVVLFSGTNEARQWRPWSRRSLVLRERVRCRPCHRKTCPLAGHPCMSGIAPLRVHQVAKRWWARLHGSESPHAPI
jgi:heptosyltransferase-2